jgi:hypothetical protein
VCWIENLPSSSNVGSNSTSARLHVMNTLIICLWVGLVALTAGIGGCVNKPANGQMAPPPAPRKAVSFDQQWEIFRRLGFDLNPTIEKSVLDEFRNDKSIEERPYFNLYIELGRTIEKEPWTPLTDRVWNFDTEAIEDNGDYVDIMKNLERVSRGEIRFENLKDRVDLEEGVAWVSFTVRGRSYKWDLKVDDDWVDATLFTKVAALTSTLRTKGRYTYFDTGGQDVVIGYETPEGRQRLIAATGLKVEWMN